MSVSAYDFNGNILKLNRKDAQGNHMDSLLYTYGNSNQLQKVKDHSGNEEGFKDSSVDDTDYSYDDNGNMISDDNKEIASIKYNYLNLPDTVLFNDGKQLVLVYDATGTKLQQHTIDGATVKSTDYFGALYLENDTLQFIHTAEGRIVLKDGEPIYEYFLTDHLGNVRTTFTTKPETEVFETSFETTAQPLFDNYAEQNRDMSYARTGSYSSRLSSADNQLIGLAKSLKVYPGDTVNATAYVRQLAGTTGNVNNLFTLLAQGFAGAFANTPLGLEGNLNSFSEALYPTVGTGGLMDKDDSDATPKLYLNMLYLIKT